MGFFATLLVPSTRHSHNFLKKKKNSSFAQGDWNIKGYIHLGLSSFQVWIASQSSGLWGFSLWIPSSWGTLIVLFVNPLMGPSFLSLNLTTLLSFLLLVVLLNLKFVGYSWSSNSIMYLKILNQLSFWVYILLPNFEL